MTPAHQAAARIREALEAGPTPEWKRAREPNGRGNGWSAGPDAWLGSDAYSTQTAAAAAYIAACSPDSLRALLAERDELLKALKDALSACAFVSMSAHRRVVIDECVMYAQTEEWCKWVDEEVQPIIRAALTNKDQP